MHVLRMAVAICLDHHPLTQHHEVHCCLPPPCLNDISTASIAADVQSLKKTYLAVQTPKGQAAMTTDGDIVDGSGGDFGAARIC